MLLQVNSKLEHFVRQRVGDGVSHGD